MPIRVQCGQCGKAYNVKEQAAGKQFKCKSCGSAIRVPAQADADGDFLDALSEMETDAPPDEDPVAAGLPPRAGAQRKRAGRKRQQRAGSGLAIASLVLGIGSLLLCWLWFVSIPAALTAVILGLVARSRAKAGTVEGAGIALAGIICGATGFVLWLLFELLIAALFFGTKETFEQMEQEFEQQMEQMEEQIEEQIEEQRAQPPELNVPDDSTGPGEDVFEDPSATESDRADRIVPVIKKEATLEAEVEVLRETVYVWNRGTQPWSGGVVFLNERSLDIQRPFGTINPRGFASLPLREFKLDSKPISEESLKPRFVWVKVEGYAPKKFSLVVSAEKADAEKTPTVVRSRTSQDRGTVPAATRAATAGRSDDKHLQFNGKDAYITADTIPFDSYNTFTIETWQKNWKGPILGQGLIRDDPENGIVMSPKACGWESRKGGNHLLPVGDKLPASWNHLALVYDGKQQLIFVNGRLTSLAPVPKPGPLNKTRQFLIGALENRGNRKKYGSGLLRSVRVSKTARYTAQFAPAQQLTADGDTVLLYNFSQGQGTRVSDQAGGKRDGTIHRAVWVETARTGIASSPQHESDKPTDQETAASVQTGDDAHTTANVVADAQQKNRQGKRPFGPEQATGEPESFQAGDNPMAWASRTADGQKEWLLLEFEEAVVPTAVRVYESFNPGAVERVTVFRADGTEVEVGKLKNPKPSKYPSRTLQFMVKKGIDFPTKRVKIYLDSPNVPGWNEINAVTLSGRIGSKEVDLYAVKAEASSSFGAPPPADSTEPAASPASDPRAVPDAGGPGASSPQSESDSQTDPETPAGVPAVPGAAGKSSTIEPPETVPVELVTLLIPAKRERQHVSWKTTREQNKSAGHLKTAITCDSFLMFSQRSGTARARTGRYRVTFYTITTESDFKRSVVFFGLNNRSSEWNHLEEADRKLQIAFEGGRMLEKTMNRTGTVIKKGIVSERLVAAIPIADFLQMIKSTQHNIQVGDFTIQLGKNAMLALRDFASTFPLGRILETNISLKVDPDDLAKGEEE